MRPLNNPIPWSPAEWESTAWLDLPARRIDLAGRPEEIFIMQWAGSLVALRKRIEGQGWVYSPKWTWRESIAYLDPNAVLGSVAPRPALHEGLKAKLTMTFALNGENNRRLVMRAYKTNANLKSANFGNPHLPCKPHPGKLAKEPAGLCCANPGCGNCRASRGI